MEKTLLKSTQQLYLSGFLALLGGVAVPLALLRRMPLRTRRWWRKRLGLRDTTYRNRNFVKATLALSVLSGIGSGSICDAATFTVTRFDDIGIPDPRDAGVCQPGNCTLREAINAARPDPGQPITIRVPAGLYQLKNFTTDNELQIVDEVTITKTGSGSTAIVDAGGVATSMRAFDIFAKANFVSIGVRNGHPLRGSTP